MNLSPAISPPRPAPLARPWAWLRRDPHLWLVLLLTIPAMLPLFAPGYFIKAHDARHSIFFLVEFDRSFSEGALLARVGTRSCGRLRIPDVPALRAAGVLRWRGISPAGARVRRGDQGDLGAGVPARRGGNLPAGTALVQPGGGARGEPGVHVCAVPLLADLRAAALAEFMAFAGCRGRCWRSSHSGTIPARGG